MHSEALCCHRSLIVAGRVRAPSATFAQVSYQRLLNAEKEPQNWLTYAGSLQVAPLLAARRRSTGRTPVQLKLAWAYQMQRAGRRRDVADRRRRRDVSDRAANSTVTALDVRSGRTLWTYTPNIPPDVIVIGSPPVNRGVAILDDSVFVGTVHGHLIALDAKSGARAMGRRRSRTTSTATT